jgi:hypothetical protein
MWLFLPFGFFSVVVNGRNYKQLMVRARNRADLERLLSRYPRKAEILHTPNADYPYRIVVPRGSFARFMAKEVETMQTDNFKSAAMKLGGFSWELLHSIWDVLRAKHEDAQARIGATPRPRPTR